MPGYRINIDGDVYEGYYTSDADAVFGAMLKRQNDIYNSGLTFRDLREGRCTKEEYAEDSKRRQNKDSLPKLIGVELIPDFRKRHKAKRVK